MELMTVRGAAGTALQAVATELAECLQSAASAYTGAD
jgi:Excreted virulence factor EspC, type VII ESX diderm